MTSLETEILAALRDLDAAARAMATSQPPPSLLPIFARLDALARQLPPGADPELRHFLDRKSYDKARQRLEGRAPARGTCGH